jgi:transcriptional repressor NrdR
MQCPFCKTDDSRVIDTRVTDGGSVVRRRRECVQCSKRFTTYERPETGIRLLVVKKDNSRVPYERGKVLAGLQTACYKRPVSEAQLEALVDRIEEKILAQFDREVPSKVIGEQVAEGLKDVDEIAYVRFASVYREFRDLGEFIEEARGIIDSQARESPGQRKLFDETE